MGTLNNLSKSLCITACAFLSASCCFAVDVSGWSMGESGMWRLADAPDYHFESGSPAKLIRADRAVMNRQARFKLRSGLVNSFTFRVSCVFQSKVPAFELDVEPLDIRISDQFNGYAFARFAVDDGQEYSLRAEYLPPARLIFAPLSRSQEKKISDLFIQLNEGGNLRMALLQGEHAEPRVYSVPLAGFAAMAGEVSSDCVRLNSASGKRNAYAPDYLTSEPSGYVKKGYSVKKKQPNDGLSPADQNSISAQEEQAGDQEAKEPEVHYFEPGGGTASIGNDGMPITKDSTNTTNTKDQDDGIKPLNDGAPMSIGSDGSPH